jgi:hypothetical protein
MIEEMHESEDLGGITCLLTTFLQGEAFVEIDLESFSSCEQVDGGKYVSKNDRIYQEVLRSFKIQGIRIKSQMRYL